ncbi:SMC family ATPase [bacterium]|nr:SMC family ATPase [bacterium]
MQLLKLEVRNWVHHRQRTCEFTRGLVAILGENGSGKSSLFGAIRWALTGENPNFGVKADNISQYAKEGEPSFVTLEFEHNGHIAIVTRYLLPEKEPSILSVDGKEAARGDKAVTAAIEKLLGVDAKFIGRFIIVGQTDIFSFIDDNQTDTDKFFQRLFNTAKADKCQDVIGKSVAKIQIPEIVKTSSQLLFEKQAVEHALVGVEQQIRKLPSFDEFLKLQKSDQEILKQWEAREKAATDLTQLGQQEIEYEKQLESIKADSQQHEDDLAALVDVTSGQESAHAAARSALGHWQSYKSVAKAKAEFQAAREALSAQRLANVAVPAIAEGVIEEKLEHIGVLRKQLKELEKFVATFSADGIACCPTCMTPTSDLQEHLKRTQVSDIPLLKSTIAENEAALKKYQEVDAAYKTWEKKDRELDTREKQLAEAEAKLVAVKPPEKSEDELKKTVNEYEEFQRVKAEITPIVMEAREKKGKLSGTLERIKEQRVQLKEQIADIKVTQADAHLAETRLAKLREQVAARQKLDQEKNQLVFDRDKLDEQYEATKRQEKESVKTRQWLEIAEQAREALKNAPRLVAQRNLLKLETAINELLQIFGVNFVVAVAEDGTPSFRAKFVDGRDVPAQRLSIGQKTVLALAFRVAVNAMFAEEIGLLALDEPTASLDAARIRALAPVLEKLRDLSTSKGLQCLLVTHASNLSHLFESTIELEAPELRHVPHN